MQSNIDKLNEGQRAQLADHMNMVEKQAKDSFEKGKHLAADQAVDAFDRGKYDIDRSLVRGSRQFYFHNPNA